MQGRVEPFLNRPKRTWTLDSRHRWGLAADLAMIRRETGEAVWAQASWRWLYEVAPPGRYGLRHLGGVGDWVHVEFGCADALIEEAGLFGLEQS